MLPRVIIKSFLKAAAHIYKCIVNCRNALYDRGILQSKEVQAKVISVGNITWGGTGKTPITIMLAHHLKSIGKKVAVLTRGYGGDECLELKDRLKGVPVLVGKNRFSNALRAEKEHQVDYIILDDGFQHRKLRRDSDVVAINTTNPFGNGGLIPSGSLREPLRGLSRASCFVLTQSFLGRHNAAGIRQKLKEINPKALVFEADHQPRRFVDFRKNRHLPLDMVKGQRVAVLSGIEDPISFEHTITRLGAKIVYAARYQDHHQFTKKEINHFFGACKDYRARYVISTAKDAYRLRNILSREQRHPTRIIILEIEMRMDDEEAFVDKCTPRVIASSV